MTRRPAVISDIILIGPVDWEPWLQRIRLLAISGRDVWNLINPDHQTQPEHVEPQPPFLRAGAQSYQDLDADEKECWKLDYQLMKDYGLQRYHDERKKLEEISYLILNSVAQQHVVCLYDKDTIWEQLRALKSQFASPNPQRSPEAPGEYAQTRFFGGNPSGYVQQTRGMAGETDEHGRPVESWYLEPYHW